MISARDIATVGGVPLLITVIAEATDRDLLVGLAAELPEEAAEQLRAQVRTTITRALEILGRGASVDEIIDRLNGEHPLLGEHIYLVVGDGPIRLCLT